MTTSALSAQHRKLLLLFIVAAFALGVKTTLKSILLDHRPRVDLHVFLIAGHAINEGLSPYRGAYENNHYFVYPQAFALVVGSPLARISKGTADTLWMTASGLFFALMVAFPIAWAWKKSGGVDVSSRRIAAFAATAMALSFSPVHYGWRLGQAELFIGAIVGGLFLAPARWRPVVAGLLLGITTVLKASPVLIVPALALAFGWRFVSSFAAVVVAYVAFLFASDRMADEVYLFTQQIRVHEFRALYPANSVHSLICLHLFPERLLKADGYYNGWVTTLVTGAMLGAYAATGLWLWMKRAHWLSLLAVGVAFAHLASPFLESHHETMSLLWMVPMAFLAIARAQWGLLRVVGFAWVVGMVFIDFSDASGGSIPEYSLLLVNVCGIAAAFVVRNLEKDSP